MRFGVHIRMDHGLVGSLERAHDLDCQAVQLFSGNPTGWARKPLDPDTASEFAAKAAALDIHPIIIHTPYLVNLAAPDDTIWSKSRDTLADACVRAPMLGGDRVVTHIGSHRGAGYEAGVQRIVEAVSCALDAEPRTSIALELGCGSGNSIGSRFEEIADILSRVDVPAERLGICIDTAHLYAAGYDISTPGGVGTMFADLKEHVGLNRLLLVHLNDTQMPLGSHRDRHYHVGSGNIGLDGFRAIVNYPGLEELPAIIETPADHIAFDHRNLWVLRELASPPRIKSPTVSGVTQSAAGVLGECGIESPLLEAQLLIAHALNCTRLDLIAHPERVLTEGEAECLMHMVSSRTLREPLAYIIGHIEFFGLDLGILPGVLVPRPETEILVEQTLARVQSPNPKIADIGTGSGAIAMALAANMPDARIYATDLSPVALKVARANVEKHHLSQRVTILEGNLLDPLAELVIKFDAIASNPPYIPTADIRTLQPEVSEHEPIEALDGGPDGLRAYRQLLPGARPLLADGGFVAVEIGVGQSRAVRAIAKAAGYRHVEVINDLAGIKRVVVAVT